ncbi:glycosyltransferase family 4 protein [Domibacillus mangrovi]|uniref:Glycosyltransferase family 1 protein n=1 Tax=Domibacillus mangrovi TaxID=1714354 RepID=A0A1Q5P5X4_9BACI|nr:glycosyltransferase family 4 protein [Domibacillus mangrovi]OKL37669.1 hypothetical protein BLL40_05050 [Domibacillus mangrovi]
MNKKIIHIVTVSKSVNLMKGQLEFLKANGYSPLIISSPGEELEFVRKNRQVDIQPVQIEREISIIKDLKSLIKLILVLKKEKPVLTNVSTPKAGLLGGIAAFITRVPCRVYTLRGLRFETTSGLKRVILMNLERLSCALAHEVICISPSLKSKAIDFKLVSKEKVNVLGFGSSNGLDLSFFPNKAMIQDDIDEITQNLKIPKDYPTVGFVGRLTKDKGIEDLIEAYKLLLKEKPTVQLLLVGDYESGDPIDRKLVEEIAKNPQIFKTGFVKSAVPYYYLMDILIFPTHREGFGNVSIEAAACSIPVITTEATGARDTVEKDKTGYVVPIADFNAISEKAALLLNNKNLRVEMGRNGRKMVEQKFRSSFIWKELLNTYERLLKGNTLK